MGRWKLEDITVLSTESDSPQFFGNHVHGTFRMRYSSSLIGKFVETPEVIWHERILMKEVNGQTRTWWEFECNQYDRSGTSRTFAAWVARYHAGYSSVAGVPAGIRGGSVRMLDKRGQAIAMARINPDNLPDAEPADRADLSRRYLQKKGGILNIEIYDRPGISLTTDWDIRERYLYFTMGVSGGALWRRAKQTLRAVRNRPRNEWERTFVVGPLERGDEQPVGEEFVDTSGFTQVDPPDHATNVQDRTYTDGEFR